MMVWGENTEARLDDDSKVRLVGEKNKVSRNVNRLQLYLHALDATRRPLRPEIKLSMPTYHV